MKLSQLTSDEFDMILGACTAKTLVSVKATSSDFCASARRALDSPRFADRKEAAALGAELLKAKDTEWFARGEAPKNSARSRRLTQLHESFMSKYWSRDRELEAGMRVAEVDENGMTFPGRGVVQAIHEDERVDILIEYEDNVVNVARSQLMQLWPTESSLRGCMLAMQDWDPRVFAYMLLNLTIRF